MANLIRDGLKNLNALAAQTRGLLALEEELDRLGGLERLAQITEQKGREAEAVTARHVAATGKAEKDLADKLSEIENAKRVAEKILLDANAKAASLLDSAHSKAAEVQSSAKRLVAVEQDKVDRIVVQAKTLEAEMVLCTEAARQKMDAAKADLANIETKKERVENEIARLKNVFRS